MKKEELQPSKTVEQNEDALQPAGTGKKPFVEPIISAPVNVFDATTFFFQGTEIGGDG